MTDERIRELCTRLRESDPAALHEMFLYLAVKLRPLASTILRRDFPRLGLQAETDDILNDVLCKLIPYLRNKGEAFCTDVGSFHRLTGTVLRRTLISLVRKHHGSLRAQQLGEMAQETMPELWEPSQLDGWSDRFRIHELIDKLSEHDRTVIELAIYVNLSNIELAKCLGINPGNASRHFLRAKEKLGQLLRADDQKTG